LGGLLPRVRAPEVFEPLLALVDWSALRVAREENQEEARRVWVWVYTAACNRGEAHKQALGLAVLNCKLERLFVDFAAVARSCIRTVM
ncbi:MAG: hypothetical protein GY772_22830, partial [bacterium]|nr:hypothetical protein [bacterium]